MELECTGSSGFGVEVDVGDIASESGSGRIESGEYCAVMFQYPDTEGNIRDFSQITHKCRQVKVECCSYRYTCSDCQQYDTVLMYK